jgi:hypothetical protein
MTMIDPQPLTHLLREELALQTRHCRLLETQQAALMNCDRSRFAAVQQEYAALAERLKVQTEARLALMCDEDGHALPFSVLLEALPETDRKQIVRLRERVQGVLEHAQGLCRRNEKLIQNELRYIAFALELFVDAGRRADNGYGGRGLLARRRLLDRRA